MIDKKTEQILLKVADYENNDKQQYSKRLFGLFITAIIAFILYGVLDFMGLTSTKGYEGIASFALGIVFGTLLVGALYTSQYMAKIHAFKHRLIYKARTLNRDKEDNDNAKDE